MAAPSLGNGFTRAGLAYTVELAKALRQRSTYLGPVLVVAATLAITRVHPVARDGVSDYGFIAYATPAVLNLLGLMLLLIYSAGLMSSELSSGTLRMLMVRPLHRHEVLAAKLLLGMTYAAALTVLVAATSWAAAWALGELSGVHYGGEVLYTAHQMRRAYFYGLLLSLPPQLAAVSFAVMVSTLTRNTASAIGGTIGVWLILDLVKYPLGVAPYLFLSYMETPWQVFAAYAEDLSGAAWFPQAYYCLAASLGAALLFVVVAGAVLHRRNLQG